MRCYSGIVQPGVNWCYFSNEYYRTKGMDESVTMVTVKQYAIQ